MELSLREWLIIGGGIVVALIVLDGWRRMQGNRNTLKMGIDTSLTDIPEENYNPELPGGGFRVLDSEGKAVTKPVENPALQLNTFVDDPVDSPVGTPVDALRKQSNQVEPEISFSAERDPLFEPLDDFNSMSEGVSAARVVKSEPELMPEPVANSVGSPDDAIDHAVADANTNTNTNTNIKHRDQVSSDETITVEALVTDPVDDIPVMSEPFIADLGPATDHYDQPEPLFEPRSDELSTEQSGDIYRSSITDQTTVSDEDKTHSVAAQQPEYKNKFEPEPESESEPEFKEQVAEEQLSFDAYSEPEPEPNTVSEPEPDIVRPQFSASRTQSADEDDLIASLPEGFSCDPQQLDNRSAQTDAFIEDELDLSLPVSELMRRTQADDNGPQQESMDLVEIPEPKAEPTFAPLLNEEPVTTETDSLYTDDLSDNSDIDPLVDGKSLQTVPEADKVLVISVVAPEAAPDFNGRSLLQIVQACGMRYGDMKIFHRYEDGIDKGAIQFSMTNALEPGYFELDAMEQLETRGVTFFMSMEEPRDVMNAYECMLATAEAVAKNLHGELMDENRSTMRSQTKEHYRERIRKFEMRKLKQSV